MEVSPRRYKASQMSDTHRINICGHLTIDGLEAALGILKENGEVHIMGRTGVDLMQIGACLTARAQPAMLFDAIDQRLIELGLWKKVE